MEFLLAVGIVSRQAIGPQRQQRLVVARGKHQQVFVGSARHFVGFDHLHTHRRVAGGLAKTAEHGQECIQFRNARVVRQHHRGF